MEHEGGCKTRLIYEGQDYAVELWLPEEQTWRWAGNYDATEGLLFCKRQPRHLHKILNSWGISSYIVDMLTVQGLKKIVVFVEGTREVYETTLENLKTECVFKYWKEQGFDRQMFLALPLWTKKK